MVFMKNIFFEINKWSKILCQFSDFCQLLELFRGLMTGQVYFHGNRIPWSIPFRDSPYQCDVLFEQLSTYFVNIPISMKTVYVHIFCQLLELVRGFLKKMTSQFLW